MIKTIAISVGVGALLGGALVWRLLPRPSPIVRTEVKTVEVEKAREVTKWLKPDGTVVVQEKIVEKEKQYEEKKAAPVAVPRPSAYELGFWRTTGGSTAITAGARLGDSPIFIQALGERDAVGRYSAGIGISVQL